MKVVASLIALALLGAAAPPAPRCHAPDGAAAIPAGVVAYGEDGDGAPGRRIAVAAFRIDRHEVTNRQFARFVTATHYVTAAEREGGGPVFIMPPRAVPLDDPRSWWHMIRGADWRHPRGPATTLAGHSDDPVVQVSYEDAAAYARWAGGGLPSAAQWERAARGGQTGPRPARSWVDAGGRAIANSWQGVFPILDTGDDGHVGIAPVGCYDANSFGLFDMIGNVWEWTTDAPAPGRRLIKGGSYLCAENYCANYRPAAWQAQEHDLGASHIGFRVAYLPG
ncbi:SUMF1/EgtB/PvdO family nonheme iron enzyme [Sphingomonas sp. GC_Shp_3]|uniref:SUMF1/EgtB/PvdO family nonheme iron enzyme n=1 Tax=Sphingomonas sp. GC_Shp_3 TaxID=2937383 RepID=UPI00226A856D